MTVTRLTEDEVRSLLWQHLNSRRYWAIPWVSERSGAFCEELERRFYHGTASADFSLVLCPSNAGVFAVALAHKRRLAPSRLARVMRAYRLAVDRKRLTERDILLVANQGPDMETATLRALTWHGWMTAGGAA